MTERHYFIETCLEQGMSYQKAEKAWEKFSDLRKHISNNWDRIKNMRYLELSERLALRTQAAEQGVEMTPYEVNGLIDIITMVQDGMDEWKDKAAE